MKQTLSAYFSGFYFYIFLKNQLKLSILKSKKVYNAAVYCDDDLLGKNRYANKINPSKPNVKK